MKILLIRNMPNYMDVFKKTYNIQEIGLAAALIRKGHQCDIVFWTNKEEKIVEINVENSKEVIKVYYCHGLSIFKNSIYHIDDIIKKYDIIQGSEYNQIQSLILALKYPKKTIIYHGQYYGKENRKYNIWSRLIDPLFIPLYKRKKTLFMTKSNYAKQYLVKKGIKDSNVFAVGVGINKYSLLNNDETIPEEIKKILTDKTKYKLLYIGEYASRRHIEFMGDIVFKLNQEGFDTKLITIGGSKTKYGKKCKEYFEKNCISQFVLNVERCEQKYLSAIYKTCDCFLFPSTYEIFGMVLLEAMYFNMNVISCDNGGSEMLINNQENGYIINNLNLKEWVDLIKNILTNINTKNIIGFNAKKSIENYYTWDSIVESFINVYEIRYGKER